MGNDALKSSSKHRNQHRTNSHTSHDEIDLATNGVQTHQQNSSAAHSMGRMSKLRRSFSLRRSKKNRKPNNNSSNTANTLTQPTTTGSTSIESANSSKPSSWLDDERKVRDGTCSFRVKYLGPIEVADSRGMHICEQAIDKLLKMKKKSVKAILYVSGDSLRVVDETNKALLVDQTIEKVSFCAPDRYHENGFAYICRDGTTRRWLCHGFMAIKDTIRNISANSSGGERLSHAVGCAFSVCLEKKQKRERENVTMEVGPNHSFTRLGSFRQASLTERLEDPQIVMPAADVVPIKKVDNPYAIERPKGNIEILNRQGSLRAMQSPFKRNTNAYTSLKPGELPSIQQQKLNAFTSKLTNTTSSPQKNQESNSNNISDIPTTTNQINTINEVPEDFLQETLEQRQTHTFNELNTVNSHQISQTPPPLPPMPKNINFHHLTTNRQQQQQEYSSSIPTLPPLYSSPPIQQQTLFTQLEANTQLNNSVMYNITPSILTTPQSPPVYLNQTRVYNPTPQNPSIQQQQTPILSNNETFEAKWARMQANKKQTNPFAEDIAKKFEIKL